MLQKLFVGWGFLLLVTSWLLYGITFPGEMKHTEGLLNQVGNHWPKYSYHQRPIWCEPVSFFGIAYRNVGEGLLTEEMTQKTTASSKLTQDG